MQRGHRPDAEEQTPAEEGRSGPGDHRLCCLRGQKETDSGAEEVLRSFTQVKVSILQCSYK